MNALAGASQSSLKLVERAEIQICRTGVLGVTTNLPGGSSKTTFSNAALLLDFEAGFVLFFAGNQVLLKCFEGALGHAAKLYFVLHDSSVAIDGGWRRGRRCLEDASNRREQNLNNASPHPICSKAFTKSIFLRLRGTGRLLTDQRPPKVHKLHVTRRGPCPILTKPCKGKLSEQTQLLLGATGKAGIG